MENGVGMEKSFITWDSLNPLNFVGKCDGELRQKFLTGWGMG